MTQSGSYKCRAVLQTIQLCIRQGITVWIPGHQVITWNSYQSFCTKYLFVIQMQDIIIFFIGSAIFTGHYYVSWVPAYFIMPGIVIAFRSNQTTAMRKE